jgi:hypothetical protein
MITGFSPEVASKIGSYVYLYLDPETEEVFYVGKGKGNRAFVHLNDSSETEKTQKIKDLRKKRLNPKIEILAHGLDSESAALLVETAVIDLLGVKRLTNRVRGWRSGQLGRLSVEHVVALYGAREAHVTEPSLLIRINEQYRYGMTPIDLYDATRGVWRIGEKREKAELALAVFEGVVQEVYAIRSWHPAGSTFSTRGDLTCRGRWEFVGNVAEAKTRKKYYLKSVRKEFAQGSQNPIHYLNL